MACSRRILPIFSRESHSRGQGFDSPQLHIELPVLLLGSTGFFVLAHPRDNSPSPRCDEDRLSASLPDMGDELVNSVRAFLAENDPDVLAAIEDVDRSLIRSELRRSPLERLVASVQQARFYERLAVSRKSAQGGSR